MKKSLVKLVVGLGNYSLPTTRHSVGMSALNKLAENLRIPWTYDRKCSGFVAKYLTEKFEVILLKPKLAMNINGKSILRAVNQHNISMENVILVQDDLDRPLGKIRVKLNGSASGHNGVRSAIASLKTDKLKRYKIGIGRPADRADVVTYVLQTFHPREQPMVDETLSKCVELLLDELEFKSESNTDIEIAGKKDREELVNEIERTKMPTDYEILHKDNFIKEVVLHVLKQSYRASLVTYSDRMMTVISCLTKRGGSFRIMAF